jgi:CHAT domain-containing protein
LPLHAAGCYDSSTRAAQEKIYNYVVSSYAPSISALIKQNNTNLSEFHGITAVSQPYTADSRLGRLPGTIEEVLKIKGLFPENIFTWLKESESTKATVLEKISRSSWLHLACHGVQRRGDPMESAFLLYDEPLNLRTISRQKLPNARLAFLSACQTATGEESLPNEAAHLAAGLLMIGYHSVIGTMWSIKDQDAPLVSKEFYKYLITRNMETKKGEVAYALHEAVGKLREQVGANQFARWVPFIHLGI